MRIKVMDTADSGIGGGLSIEKQNITSAAPVCVYACARVCMDLI